MVSASPTIFALDIDSAWVVILAVSLVTLPATLLLRRMIGRHGGLASGFLLLIPLLLPVIAAAIFARGLMPEIAVLKPAARALLERPSELVTPFFLSDGRMIAPYALVGRAGPWLLLFGLTISSFMLARRAVGWVLVRRLLARCTPAGIEDGAPLEIIQGVAAKAHLKRVPDVLLLPDGVSGAFALGGRHGKILVSRELVDSLEPDELEAILAHEVAHIEARDVQVVVAAGFLRDMIAWNPLSHMAYRRLTADREIEADRRAALLTGSPLALASGLLKMRELMRGERRRAPALALLRPGGRITRRVTNLLAIADGKTMMDPAGRLPYLFAAALVAVLGLNAAARLAAQEVTAVALVWGAPDAAEAPVWRPTMRAPQPDGRPGNLKHRRFGGYVEPLAAGIVFNEKHVPQWIDTISRLARRSGVPRAALQWETRAGWQATPLLGGPIPLYMMELRPVAAQRR